MLSLLSPVLSLYFLLQLSFNQAFVDYSDSSDSKNGENFSCHLTDEKKAARWQPTYITTYLQLIINLKKILS